MVITHTDNRNLEKIDNTSNVDEVFNGNADILDEGTLFAIIAGAALTEFQAIYIAQADDKAELADADVAAAKMVIGLVKDATIAEDADGFAYGAGAVVTNDAWDWDMSKAIFLSATPGALTQTAPADSPILVGFPTAPTIMVLTPIYLNFQLATIADPAQMAAVTFLAHGWDGATDPTQAEGDKIVADLAAFKTAVDANNTAIDSILTRLESLGISAIA